MRGLAELSLIAIAAVWGLTFVMVQDAIETLPPMAFLGYRFIPAGLLVGVAFWRPLRSLSPGGWAVALLMGVFLTAAYVAQTFGLEHTTASEAGFITGLFVVLTPLFGALVLRLRVGRAAWSAAIVSALGLFLLSGTGGRFELAGDGLELICACVFAAQILVTSRAVTRHHVGALVAIQLTACGLFCLVVAAAAGQLDAPEGGSVWSALVVTALVARALGFLVQSYAQQQLPPARTALILAAEPAFAGLFGYLLNDERLSVAAWAGAVLILAAIVAVDVAPRLRPPRPLPEG
jgi:drug/metabolite transporter (DMT)-like permease